MVLVETKPISPHRSRMDIIADILLATTEKKRKTNIMYSCNLSFEQLDICLDLLLNKRLLRESPGEKSSSSLFETTDNGRAFLDTYANLKTLLKA